MIWIKGSELKICLRGGKLICLSSRDKIGFDFKQGREKPLELSLC